MKFSIGDPVFVVSNNEEAIITEFIGKDMCAVKTNTSSYHVYLSDIEHPYLRWFLNKKKKDPVIKYVDSILIEKNHNKLNALPDGFYLGFMPLYVWDGIDEAITKVKVYFFNQSEHELDLNYNCLHKNQLLFQIKTRLRPLEEFYVHDLDFEIVSTNPEFQFQFEDTKNDKLFLEYDLGLKPKKFFAYTDKLRYENKPIFHIQLFDYLKPRLREEIFVNKNLKDIPKSEMPSFFDFEKAKKNVKYEVDLHIEKLLTQWNNLSGAEMLNIQLTEFQKALELAISTHQQSIVFIHGMGSGRLKKEIVSVLNQTKWVYKYVNDYDVRYGYGATEVFFHH